MTANLQNPGQAQQLIGSEASGSSSNLARAIIIGEFLYKSVEYYEFIGQGKCGYIH